MAYFRIDAVADTGHNAAAFKPLDGRSAVGKNINKRRIAAELYGKKAAEDKAKAEAAAAERAKDEPKRRSAKGEGRDGKGGKPFDPTQKWFVDLLKDIGQA